MVFAPYFFIRKKYPRKQGKRNAVVKKMIKINAKTISFLIMSKQSNPFSNHALDVPLSASDYQQRALHQS